MVKNTIIFLLGACIGAASGYFAASKLLTDKIRDEEAKKAQEDINEMKRVFKEKENRIVKIATDNTDEKENYISVGSGLIPEVSTKPDVESYNKILEQNKYTKYSKPPKKKSETDKALEDYYAEKEESEKETKPQDEFKREVIAEHPYIITEEEFRTDCVHSHSKETLFFDPATGIVLDEDDVPVENTDYILGTEFIHALKTKERVFVRNERAASDFEIVREGEFDDD